MRLFNLGRVSYAAAVAVSVLSSQLKPKTRRAQINLCSHENFAPGWETFAIYISFFYLAKLKLVDSTGVDFLKYTFFI